MALEVDPAYEFFGQDGTRAVLGNGPAAMADPDWCGLLNAENGIAGLIEGAEVRGGMGQRPGRSGGYPVPGLLSSRDGTITGVLNPNLGAAARLTTHERLSRAVYALDGDGVLRWTPTGGAQRMVRFRTKAEAKITGRIPKSFSFSLETYDPVNLGAVEKAAIALANYSYGTEGGFGDPFPDPLGRIAWGANLVGNPSAEVNATPWLFHGAGAQVTPGASGKGIDRFVGDSAPGWEGTANACFEQSYSHTAAGALGPLVSFTQSYRSPTMFNGFTDFRLRGWFKLVTSGNGAVPLRAFMTAAVQNSAGADVDSAGAPGIDVVTGQWHPLELLLNVAEMKRRQPTAAMFDYRMKVDGQSTIPSGATYTVRTDGLSIEGWDGTSWVALPSPSYGLGQVVATNAGNMPTWPRFRIETIAGSGLSPVIRNLTTGESTDFAWVADGSTLDVYPERGLITLSNAAGTVTDERYDLLSFANNASTWWQLRPGDNVLQLGHNGAGTSMAANKLTAYWRDAYK